MVPGIIKITALILAAVLTAALIIIMLLLFVPVRYSVSGSYGDHKPDIKASLSWLLGIINMRASVSEDFKVCARLHILGIRAFDFPEGKSGDKEEDVQLYNPPVDSSRPLLTSQGSGTPSPEGAGTFQRHTDVKRRGTACTAAAKKVDSGSGRRNNERESHGTGHSIHSGSRLKDKMISAAHSLRERFRFIKKKKDRFAKIIDLFGNPYYSEALSLLKKKLLSVLKELCPRKGRCSVMFGMSDPAVTAQVCEALIMLWPIYGDHLEAVPDFGGEKLDLDLDIRGRIRLIVLADAALRIFLSRKLRLMYRKIRAYAS